MNPGLVGAAGEIEADPVAVIGKAIELKPQHIGRDFGRRLDGHATHGAERIGHARPLRRRREITIGARPHDRGPAHGGDADRRRIGAPEQHDADRRQLGGPAIARD